MISNQLPYDEDDALKRILRHHGVALDRQLVRDLSALINWVHMLERSKFQLGTFKERPPYMLAFLGQLGIYGGEAISSITTHSEIEDTQ